MSFENVKIIDCTIRDGGLINNWKFDNKIVREIYTALSNAHIDYMEIGYKVSKKIISPMQNGKWRFCEEDDVKKVIQNIESNTQLGFMVDVGRVEQDDILPQQWSIFKLARIAAYDYQIDEAIELAKSIHDKGYEVFINVMAISKTEEAALQIILEKLERCSSIDGVYLVDSYGALYPKDIRKLSLKFLSVLKKKALGIHAHNNQQLAFANTIEALSYGFEYVDATVNGLGRASGNCPLELIVPYLNNQRYELKPILNTISTTMNGMKKNMKWGYLIPYMITGLFNIHPRNVDAFKEEIYYDKIYEKLV